MGETQAQHDHCVLDPACASRRLFEAISGKWSPLMVMALKDGGKKRHGELRRELGGISQKMLIQTLRDLERNGLVERKVYPVVPPKVEYSLTPPRAVPTALARGHMPMVRTTPQGGREGTPRRGRKGVPVRRVDAGYRTKGLFSVRELVGGSTAVRQQGVPVEPKGGRRTDSATYSPECVEGEFSEVHLQDRA